MIRLILEQGGKKLVMIGIERADVEKLTAGHILPMDASPGDGADHDIAVMYGETAQALVDALRNVGLNIPDKLEHGRSYTTKRPWRGEKTHG